MQSLSDDIIMTCVVSARETLPRTSPFVRFGHVQGGDPNKGEAPRTALSLSAGASAEERSGPKINGRENERKEGGSGLRQTSMLRTGMECVLQIHTDNHGKGTVILHEQVCETS